jgi:hypothetical protein
LDSVLELAVDGLNFLQHHVWSDVHSDRDFTVSIAVAKIVLEAADHKPGILARQMTEQGGEVRAVYPIRYECWCHNLPKRSRHNLGVRAWNVLILAALSSTADSWGANLFAYFPNFTLTYYNALRTFTQSGVYRSESAAASINHAYASIKLWLLLVHKSSSRRVHADPPGGSLPSPDGCRDTIDALMVWNELWPHFERVVNVFEAEADTGAFSVRWGCF